MQLLILGSDNISCLVSHNSIPYVHQTNKILNGVILKIWVYIESCTGKNKLNSHFCLVNITSKSFVMYSNDTLNEVYIDKGLCIYGSVTGYTVLLFDGKNLVELILRNEQKFMATHPGVREIREVIWNNDTPHVYTISDITTP